MAIVRNVCLDLTNQGLGFLDAISVPKEHSRPEHQPLPATSVVLASISQQKRRQLAMHASLECLPCIKVLVHVSRVHPILGPIAAVGQLNAPAMLAITTFEAGP